MCKFKVWHTVDAVLAGYYEDEATGTIDSLLFGLYGDDGLLHFVGHSRVYFDAAEIAKLLDPLKGGTGLTGRAPGGKSRWTGKTQKMVRLDPVPIQPCQSLRQSPVAMHDTMRRGNGIGDVPRTRRRSKLFVHHGFHRHFPSSARLTIVT